MQNLTPLAALAIVQQIEKAADTGEGTDFAGYVNGTFRIFEARFSREWDSEERYIDTHSSGYGRDQFAVCKLVGAWAYDDDGEIDIAGNRAEIVAMVGDARVSDWEAEQSEIETERGE